MPINVIKALYILVLPLLSSPCPINTPEWKRRNKELLVCSQIPKFVYIFLKKIGIVEVGREFWGHLVQSTAQEKTPKVHCLNTWKKIKIKLLNFKKIIMQLNRLHNFLEQ